MIQQGITRRTRLTPEQRKKQLLEIALQVSAARGLGKAGHSDIAQKTGVAVATVFHYFKTKDVLIVEIVREVEAQLIKELNDIHLQSSKTCYEKMTEHVSFLLGLVENKPELLKVYLEWSTAIRSEVWIEYLNFQQKILTLISGSIKTGKQSGELMAHVDENRTDKMVFSIFQWALVMSYQETPSIDLKLHVEESLKTILPLSVVPQDKDISVSLPTESLTE